jgi:hypothetical protein
MNTKTKSGFYLILERRTYMDFENDVPKYRKKSTRQPPVKSKHKHLYKDCLLKKIDENKAYKSEYCTVCGKIGKTLFFETKPFKNGYRIMISQEELLSKYKDLEIFNINEIWDKYVTLTTE